MLLISHVGLLKSQEEMEHSDKLKQVTQKPSLLKKQPIEKYEFELVRFGRGQLFGEIQHVVDRSLQ